MSHRYIILDPGFEHHDSHHEVVNSRILSAANESDEIIIVAGKQYQEAETENKKCAVKVLPFFDLNMYPVGYHNLEHEPYQAIMADFYQHFVKLFEVVGLRGDDKLIIHTAFSYVYEALARALYFSNQQGVSVYLSTMFSPGRVAEFGDVKTQSINEVMRHKFAFGIFKQLESERDFNFCIESPTQLYLDAYQSFWPEKPMALHPSVCGGGQTVEQIKDKRVLAYLGGPKWDKGIEFTVKALVRLSQLQPDVEFVFHYNNEFPGADVYQSLVSQLTELNNDNIKIIEGNIAKDTYEDLLASASSYFLFYDPEHYQYKTSGVLWDVLRHAQGKSVFVSQNTWHEKELTQMGANYNPVEYGDVSGLVTKFLADKNNIVTPKTYRNSYVKTLLSDFGEHVFAQLKNLNSQYQVEQNEQPRIKRKRILVVRTDYGHFTKLSGPGGFVDYLPELGYEVEEVLVPLGHERVPFINDGKRWELLKATNNHLKSYQVNAFEVEQKIITQYQNFDVIHFVDGEHAGLMVALANIKGVIRQGPKLVATFHQPDYVIKDLVLNPGFIGGFDTIHLMSPCQKQSFIELGVDESKLVVVPHGVAHEHYMPALPLDVGEPASAEIKQLQQQFDGRKVIITVGNWLRDYNMVLEVARSFREHSDIVFVAVSRGLELELNQDDKNIILLNTGISDRALHWLYRRCELMFLPLKGGAANNAILEAVAANTKIITSDLPSTRYYTSETANFAITPADFCSLITSKLSNEGLPEDSSIDLSWKLVASQISAGLY
ncbi:glycosyltransferase family 4 protein [Vibrio sp. 10N]|uniref:glycosyltransferase family 4 protein n=1 Tax=Vibrio sp. 10N TaxID=3058938 RepID=UPI0028140E2A|nr:hypothetical protein VB10N_28930 [Vibrio sp. 10N]